MKPHEFSSKINVLSNFQPAGQGNANALGSDEEKTLLIDGTETLMTILFCELYNCTLAVSLGQFCSINCLCTLSITIVLLTDEEGEWGIIEDNMTGNGVIGAIVERRADFGFSALYLW